MARAFDPGGRVALREARGGAERCLQGPGRPILKHDALLEPFERGPIGSLIKQGPIALFDLMPGVAQPML